MKKDKKFTNNVMDKNKYRSVKGTYIRQKKGGKK